MKKIFPAAVLWLVLLGCTPRYYSPNAHQVPLLTQKGETTFQFAIGAGDDVKASVDVQAATAVTSHFGLMLNFYHARGTEPGYGSGSGHLFEGGAGYLQPLGSHFHFSAFAGAGAGSVTNYYDTSKIGFSELKLNRLFVQPALGYKTKHFEGAVSLRFARLRFSSQDSRFPSGSNSGADYSYDIETLQGIKAKPAYLLLEPALTIRVGWERVKLQGQLGLSSNQTQNDFSQESFNANIGLYFNLFLRKKSGVPGLGS